MQYIKRLVLPFGIFLLLIYFLSYNNIFFPENWMIKDKTRLEYISSEYIEIFELIALDFDEHAKKYATRGKLGDIRRAYSHIGHLLLLLIFLVIPLARKIPKKHVLFPVTLIQSIVSEIRENQGSASLHLFHKGADFIDKGSKWALLITLILYLVYDRQQKNIDNAWTTIIRFEGKSGEQGRKNATETLVNYNIDLVNIDLNSANLEGLDLSIRRNIFTPDTQANISLSDFSKSNLRRASFYCAIARKTDFQRSKLQEADFFLTDLRNSNFKGAEYGSILQYGFTDFSFADMRNGDFSDDITTVESKDDIYNRYSEQPLRDGAWLINSDIRGAKLGERILGIGGKLQKEMYGDVAYGPKIHLAFVIGNILSAQWDESTQFPEAIDKHLSGMGVRNGDKSKIKETEKIYTDVVMQLYMANMGREKFNQIFHLKNQHSETQAIYRLIGNTSLIGAPNISHTHDLCER